MLHNITRSE